MESPCCGPSSDFGLLYNLRWVKVSGPWVSVYEIRIMTPASSLLPGDEGGRPSEIINGEELWTYRKKKTKRIFKDLHVLFLLLTSKYRILWAEPGRKKWGQEESPVCGTTQYVELPSGLDQTPVFTKCYVEHCPPWKHCQMLWGLCFLCLVYQLIISFCYCGIFSLVILCISTICQDSGKIFSLNLVRHLLAEVQTHLLDIHPVVGFF